MRVHWLQHAQNEGLGCIEPWLRAQGFGITHTLLHLGETLPGVDEFDWLIAMGGPMNIDQHDEHSVSCRRRRTCPTATRSSRATS